MLRYLQTTTNIICDTIPCTLIDFSNIIGTNIYVINIASIGTCYYINFTHMTVKVVVLIVFVSMFKI